jgi:hypothetical protein
LTVITDPTALMTSGTGVAATSGLSPSGC